MQTTSVSSVVLLSGVRHGGGPDGKAERDLVDDVGNVVDQVEGISADLALQVAEEVAERVDGPANGDDQAHGVEGLLHMLAHLLVSTCHFAGFTSEDLEEDEAPASHAHDEASHWVAETRLTAVASEQHHDCADQQAPEHACADIRLHRREDQVELNHLQRHGDGPVNVSVDNWAASELDPVLAHVEVVHSCDQGHQGTDVQRGLPVGGDSHGRHQEEHGGRNHRNGDDPE